MLSSKFFNRDAAEVARDLLGKVVCHFCQGSWLKAIIIETEAYYLHDKASHASLGYTEKRKALFMPAGTIYMYYARGGDSLNISCRGEGNAVLIKSGYPYLAETSIEVMQRLNPPKYSVGLRPVHKLCNGQTLLCKSLGIKVSEWDQKTFDKNKFFIDDVAPAEDKVIQTSRLGIPSGRDQHLPLRFIAHKYAKYSTKPPKTHEH